MDWLLRAMVLSFCLGLIACASASESLAPHPKLRAIWSDYRDLPEQRALAIAGDPSRSRWIAGAAGGHASQEQAEKAALAECVRRRARMRMQDPCVLYAVGDQLVSKKP